MIINGVRTVVRETGPVASGEAVVFLHGNPGSSADWEPLMETVGLRAVAWDAPGFGEADKHGFPQTVAAHAAFAGAPLDALGVERAHLVLHDAAGLWGLELAAAQPERIASLTLIDAGVLLGYRWHRLARIWRTPGLGEAFMATTTRPGFRGLLRGLPRPFVDRMYDDFDAGTRRAVLELYRSFDDRADQLAARLRGLDVPVLVLWGGRDPYLPAPLALRQREVFPTARCIVLPESGHWPFVDAPERVALELNAQLVRAARPAASPRA